MWSKTADGSFVDANGQVIFFSTQRFVKDICLGDCCFICGANPNDKLIWLEFVEDPTKRSDLWNEIKAQP